jgi:ribonucleotide reductase beta subunit family protein with ferritin-like domain
MSSLNTLSESKNVKVEQQEQQNIMEPLLKEDKCRYTLFPIQYPKIYQMYKTSEKLNWFAHEIDFSKDLECWEKLHEDKKYFIKHILAFFAGSDGIVIKNLMSNFHNEITLPEALLFYAQQLKIEAVHSETYSMMIDTYLIKNPQEKLYLFRAIENIPFIAQKADWAIKWMDRASGPFAQRLVAFAVVEGVFFSGSFCAIYWLKKQNLLSGLCRANEFIARDEGMHTDFACMLYSYVVNKLSEADVHAMIGEAVEIESKFITEALRCDLLGINSGLMITYIKYVADRLCLSLGYAKIYNCAQPFRFMDEICLFGKVNFFEHDSSEYQHNTSNTLDKYEF